MSTPRRRARTIHGVSRWLRVALLSLAGAGVAGLFGVPTLLAALGDVPREARDLDCSGLVTVGEWYAAGLDYGWRHATVGPTDCSEVFSLKDGLPVVLRCPEEPHCRIVRRVP